LSHFPFYQNRVIASNSKNCEKQIFEKLTFLLNSEADSEFAKVSKTCFSKELIQFSNFSKNGGFNICKLYKMDFEYYEFDIFHSRLGHARRGRIYLPPGRQFQRKFQNFRTG